MAATVGGLLVSMVAALIAAFLLPWIARLATRPA
jgi:hypothetical protein